MAIAGIPKPHWSKAKAQVSEVKRVRTSLPTASDLVIILVSGFFMQLARKVHVKQETNGQKNIPNAERWLGERLRTNKPATDPKPPTVS